MGSRLRNQLDEHHIAVKDNNQVELLLWEQTNDDAEMLFAKYNDATWRIETREDENISVFYQFSGQSHWKPNTRTIIDVMLGSSVSNYAQPKVNKVNVRQTGVDIITDFRKDRFYGVSYSANDEHQLDELEVKDLHFQENYMRSRYKNAKASLEYLLASGDTLSAGAQFKSFSNQGFDKTRNFFPDESLENQDLLSHQLSVFDQHPDKTWVEGNLEAIQQLYGLSDIQLTDSDVIGSSDFSLQEDTRALYVQYDHNRQLWNRPLFLQGGMRYFTTTFASSGLQQGRQTSVSKTYDDLLMSLNAVWEVNEWWLLRGSVDENITRPSIRDLSITANVSKSSRNEGDIGTVFMGNPFLEPLHSVNLETGIEWYFDEGGILSFSTFFKRIKNFVVNNVNAQVYSDLGLPQSLLQDGDSMSDIFFVSTPQNSDTTTFKGVELAFTRDLTFLPAPFNGLGINSNVTFADGKALYRNVQSSGLDEMKTFAGLSRRSYNFTLYYEKEALAMRVSAAHRSRYTLPEPFVNADQDESGYHATTYVDAAISWRLSPRLKVTAEGLNLTDVREELYSDSNDRGYNTAFSGRTFLVGLAVEL